MCLYTYNTNPLVAQEDIPVFKVLLKIDGKFYAPLRYGVDYFQYGKGVNMPLPTNKDYEKYDNGGLSINFLDKKELSAGWLHSYRKEQDAVWMKNRIIKNVTGFVPFLPKGSSVVIVRMTIPKDCHYYQSDDVLDYCSKVLMWDGEILEEEDLGIV